MAEKKKLTFQIALVGAIGAAAVAYAVLRKPRFLFDGVVASCEGVDGKNCAVLSLTRENGSGKLFAPFHGRVVKSSTDTMVIDSDEQPVQMTITFGGASPLPAAGTVFKSGDMIAQAQDAHVTMVRKTPGYDNKGNPVDTRPMATSAWLAVNGLSPAKKVGKSWCEDNTQLIVPKCVGTIFTAPELPRWSLRSVQITM